MHFLIFGNTIQKPSANQPHVILNDHGFHPDCFQPFSSEVAHFSAHPKAPPNIPMGATRIRTSCTSEPASGSAAPKHKQCPALLKKSSKTILDRLTHSLNKMNDHQCVVVSMTSAWYVSFRSQVLLV